MYEIIKPLLVTPSPQKSESLMGLILRTSESNGYTSPSYILRHAGLTENEIRSVSPPIEKIAALYARNPQDFIAYKVDHHDSRKRVKKWRILNHVVPGLYVNTKTTRICPECVNENGFIDCYSELKFTHICCKHKRELISSCPNCNKPIKWQRIGILKCACGQDFSDLRGAKVDDVSIISIHELIHWKLLNHEYDEAHLNKTGYPLEQLKNASLATLIGIVERLKNGRRRKTKFTDYPDLDEKYHALKLAHEFLADWPRGFFNFLHHLSPEGRNILSRNLQAQYTKFYNSIFKSNLPQSEVQFIKKAFVDYANEFMAEEVYIDIRLSNQSETPRRYVGISGLAKHLNVHQNTVRAYLKKGYIKAELRQSMGRERKVFDIQKIPFKAREGGYLKTREAAKFLQLPMKVLIGLRNQGIYKIRSLAWGTDGYSLVDLNDFKEGFAKKTSSINKYSPEKHILIRDLFRKKRIKIDSKIKLIESILDGNILPLGRVGNEITDLVLSREILKEIDIC
jgi:hypothetical protein